MNIKSIETVEREKYTEGELEDLARDVYDQEVNVLGMTFDALRIVKELDEPYYAQLLEDLQEYVTYYLCPTCEQEYEDEDEALECNSDEHGNPHPSANEEEED